MKTSLDNKQFCTAILTDLSNAFGCICYDLLIAKLNAYGFDKKALKLFYDFLNGRSQKIELGSSFISELVISYPQGSILAHVLFNIDICDLFFINITSDIANYAGSNLELTVAQFFSWYSYHLNQHTSININGSVIKSSNCEKLLGMTIDSDFAFEERINILMSKS